MPRVHARKNQGLFSAETIKIRNASVKKILYFSGFVDFYEDLGGSLECNPNRPPSKMASPIPSPGHSDGGVEFRSHEAPGVSGRLPQLRAGDRAAILSGPLFKAETLRKR
jgi:hypothetical protein